jgi:hypothetical protein
MYEHIQHFLTLTIETVVIFGYGGLIVHYIATLLASKRMNPSEKLSAELAPDFVPLLNEIASFPAVAESMQQLQNPQKNSASPLRYKLKPNLLLIFNSIPTH